MSWIGNAINGAGSLLNLIGQGKNIDKQIWAQQQENRKNREYNLMLAQQQNKWSVEQWERENEFNSPKNQMARLNDAGINPNLAYSNGVHNISASSPSMTAGSPSTPADMSALGQKPTLGQAIQMALANEYTRAQIDNIKADTDSKSMANDVQRELKDFLGLEFKDTEGVNKMLFSPQAQRYLEELNSLKSDNFLKEYDKYNKDFDQTLRELNKDIERSVSTKQWEALSKQLDMSIQECKEFIQNASLRLIGFESEVKLKQSEASWNSSDLLDKLPDGLPMIIKLLRSIFGK